MVKREHLILFSCEFKPGIYGLLGPNGAGKSTLMNLITCNLKPTAGEIFFYGEMIEELAKEYSSKLGFMPQQQNIYPSFTVERFLMYMAGLKGIGSSEAKSETNRLLEMVNLAEDRKKRLGELSGGMKQRALLAQALLGKPEVIVLDEPTAGVDPNERIQMRNIISQVVFNCIILIATHVVPDIQFIAKEILLLGNGHIIESGTPSSLQKRMEGKAFEITTDEEHFRKLSSKCRTVQMARNEDVVILRVVSDEIPKGVSFVNARPDLEDLYLYYFDEEHHL